VTLKQPCWLTKIPHCGKSIDYIINLFKLNGTICEDIIQKNMNRIYIETHNLGVDVREVNLAGAKLAADQNQCVLGDISSTGKLTVI
jgi:hypothetical protein